MFITALISLDVSVEPLSEELLGQIASEGCDWTVLNTTPQGVMLVDIVFPETYLTSPSNPFETLRTNHDLQVYGAWNQNGSPWNIETYPQRPSEYLTLLPEETYETGEFDGEGFPLFSTRPRTAPDIIHSFSGWTMKGWL